VVSGRPSRRRQRRHRQPAVADAGYALLIALFVVFLISLALSLLGQSLALRLRMARHEARSITLTALCDAALAESLAAVAAGQASDVVEHRFGGGAVGSHVEMLDPLHFRITATARFDGRARSAVADVVRDPQGTRVVHWRRLSG
jgi:hypothetical protein